MARCAHAYGGGKGKAGEALSGGIFGTTYIALLGGKVEKDIYAACTSGQVVDVFGVGAYDSNSNPKGFTASANAYIQGGTCRNVYGAGWKGNVGSETLDGETHVVIGNKTGTTFTNGIPAILLLDKDGTILKRNLRGDDIEAAIVEALKQ